MLRKCIFYIITLFVITVMAVNKEQARERLDRLLEESRAHAQGGISWIDKQIQEIQQRAIVVLQQGSKGINQQNIRFIMEFTNIEKSAESEGKNVTSCTKSKEGLLHELVELASLELIACVDRFAERGVTVLDNALLRFNLIIKQVEDLIPGLESCAAQACIDAEMKKIEFEELDCPRKFEEETTLSGNKAESSMLLISECGLRQLQRLATQGAAIINDVQKCADKIIGG